MSEADMTGCCNRIKYMSFGCNGGQLGSTWKWLATEGVVSGGKYEED